MNIYEVRDYLYHKVDNYTANLPQNNEIDVDEHGLRIKRVVSIYGKSSGIAQWLIGLILKVVNGVRSWFKVSDWQLAEKELIKAMKQRTFTFTDSEKEQLIAKSDQDDFKHVVDLAANDIESLLKDKMMPKITKCHLNILKEATKIRPENQTDLEAKYNDLENQHINRLANEIICTYPELYDTDRETFREIITKRIKPLW